MSTEISRELVRPPASPLAPDEVTLIDPSTGEALDLATATTGQLAAYRDHVRDWETVARQAKKLTDGELLRRMDARNEHTMYEGGYKITAPASEEKTEYDSARLRELLLGLAADPEVNLDPEAVEDAVQTVVTYKARKAKVEGLRKRGGMIADVIEECSQVVGVERRVSVVPR